MMIDVDGIKLDISRFSKKITFEHKNGKTLVTYSLDFPPFTDSREFDEELKAKEFINEIKKDGDKVKYK